MSLHWYPRYAGDYIRKTRHLSMLEHGAYNLLLDHYYATGKPLLSSNATSNATLMPDHSRLYRLCSATTKEEQMAVDSVLEEFFVFTENGYINPKASEVIQKQREAHEKRVNAGRKGGKNKDKQSSSNAKAKLKQPEPEPEDIKEVRGTNVPLNKKENKKGGELKKPEDVSEQVWNDFLAHRKLKKAAVNETVISRTRNEAKKINWTLEQALIETCSRGWQGFTAQYIINDRKKNEANRTGGKGSLQDRKNTARDAAFAKYYGDDANADSEDAG